MASIHKHCELHARRTAELHERVDRGADRATGVEDVVDEHDRHPLDRERDARGPNNRLAIRRPSSVAHVHVVPMKRDVESTDGELHAASLLDQAPKPGCEGHSARLDPDERDVLEPVPVGRPVPFDELVGDPRKGLGDALGVEKSLRRAAQESAVTFLGSQIPERSGTCVDSFHSFPASLNRVKDGLSLARRRDVLRYSSSSSSGSTSASIASRASSTSDSATSTLSGGSSSASGSCSPAGSSCDSIPAADSSS